MCNKTKFATERDVLEGIERLQKGTKKYIKLYVYYCYDCKAWNITRLSQDEREEIIVLRSQLKFARTEICAKNVEIKRLKKLINLQTMFYNIVLD